MIDTPKRKVIKWDRKAARQIFVGFSENLKGYQVYELKKNTTSRYVIVIEEDARMTVLDEDSNLIWV